MAALRSSAIAFKGLLNSRSLEENLQAPGFNRRGFMPLRRTSRSADWSSSSRGWFNAHLVGDCCPRRPCLSIILRVGSCRKFLFSVLSARVHRAICPRTAALGSQSPPGVMRGSRRAGNPMGRKSKRRKQAGLWRCCRRYRASTHSFTGPLFCIFKAISAIKIASKA